MSTYDNSSIHRYLDAAFAEVPASPDAQDLKEEIRGNLSARIAELETSGVTGATAIRTAIKELGDISEILAPLSERGTDGGAGDALADATERRGAAAYLRNKVRPKPRFVVRTVVVSLVEAAGIAFVALAATKVVFLGVPFQAIIAIAAIALPAGILTADGLRQETSQNYPVPRRRATWYGVASVLGAFGLALGGIYWGDHSAAWPLFALAALIVASILVFTYLGVTQTNRKKPWVRALGEEWMNAHGNGWEGDRFSEDPDAAARFGIYMAVLWIVALGAFIALGVAIGYAWSWLVLLGAFVVQLLVLARMLFPAGQRRP
jgi:hypothetical protein